jgi:ATP-dependent helicase/nuclease subunit B
MRRKVEKMSPTDFSEYLACPFRYYLKKVLWLDAFTPDAREMDSKRFGILVHEAVEKFGRETPNESAPATIERLVLDHLDGSVNVAFGPAPSPAVRIQIEGAKTRLRAFARIQAEQIAAGWRIVSTERKLEAHGENPLCIGSLHLSGKIDRIEKNTLTGAWRVLDYKTSADGPAKKHFGPRHSKEWLPDAELEIGDSEKPKKKRWANLQLPLYRKILDHWHGDEIGDNPISTGYFLLTADPAETAVLEFEELNDDVMESAMTCARTIAGLVHKGVFWPPQPLKSSWEDPFEALFLNGAPDACIAPATIQFLKG